MEKLGRGVVLGTTNRAYAADGVHTSPMRILRSRVPVSCVPVATGGQF